MKKRFEPVYFGLESEGGQIPYGYRDVFLDCPPTMVGKHWDTTNAQADAQACANILNAVYEAAQMGEEIQARIEYAGNDTGLNGKVGYIVSYFGGDLTLEMSDSADHTVTLRVSAVVPIGQKRDKPQRFTVASGRNIYRNGKPFVYISIPTQKGSGSYACPPAEADAITHEIVRLLNSGEFDQNFFAKHMDPAHDWDDLAETEA